MLGRIVASECEILELEWSYLQAYSFAYGELLVAALAVDTVPELVVPAVDTAVGRVVLAVDIGLALVDIVLAETVLVETDLVVPDEAMVGLGYKEHLDSDIAVLEAQMSLEVRIQGSFHRAVEDIEEPYLESLQNKLAEEVAEHIQELEPAEDIQAAVDVVVAVEAPDQESGQKSSAVVAAVAEDIFAAVVVDNMLGHLAFGSGTAGPAP